MIKCCRDCKERHHLCHSECERYIAEKNQNAKTMAEWRNGRVLHEYRFDKATKIMRKMRQ